MSLFNFQRIFALGGDAPYNPHSDPSAERIRRAKQISLLALLVGGWVASGLLFEQLHRPGPLGGKRPAPRDSALPEEAKISRPSLVASWPASVTAPALLASSTFRELGTGQMVIEVGELQTRLARDGSPLTIALDARGKHRVVLRGWSKDLERVFGQRQYDWRLELTVPGGGVVAHQGTPVYTAPEEGYRPTETIEMPACLPPSQWRPAVVRSYFIRFDDGLFARVNLEMQGGGDHRVIWKSFLNPNPGMRNLETLLAPPMSPPSSTP